MLAKAHDFTWLLKLNRVPAALTNHGQVSKQDTHGNTVLHEAFLGSWYDFVVDLLMGKYMLETTRNLSNEDGLSFLHIVCTRPYVDVVKKLLLEEDVDVDCKVNQGSTSIYAGCTPLHFAAAFDQREVAELLIARYNAKLCEQDARGSTPLHLALERGKLAMLDHLLTHDRRRENVVNDRGLSHFMAACAGSDELIVEEYLRAAPDLQLISATVNHVADYRFAGYTPLHFAVEFEQRAIAELLLARHNANLYVQDAKGSTPIHLALERGNFAMLDLLLTHDRRRENVVNDRGLSHFMAVCANGDKLIVEEYLRAAPDSQMINATVNRVSGYHFAGYSPLRFALEFERAKTVRLLKNRGAKCTTPSNSLASHRSRSPSSRWDSSRDDLSSSRSECRESSRNKQVVCTAIICFALGLIMSAIILANVE